MAEEKTRQEIIHSKGFNMFLRDPANLYNQYGKIKVGPKELEDAILTFGSLQKTCKGNV